METEPIQKTPIRGAIKVLVSTSTENLIAGQPFSIFVKVQNPFEIPLVLNRVSTYLPTEFLDLDLINRKDQLSELQDQIDDIRGIANEFDVKLPNITPQKRSLSDKFIKGITKVSFRTFGINIDFKPDTSIGPTFARKMTTQSATIGVKLPILGEIKQTIKEDIKEEFDEETKEKIKAQIQKDVDDYNMAIKELSEPEGPGKPLQPGNSTTNAFTIKSRHGILFKPSTYKLNIEIEYEIDGVSNIDTIEHTLNVRSSMPSMMCGAAIGASFGWFVNKGSNLAFDLQGLSSFLSSLILSMFSVVLFARKKDVQSFISIEDFWGGIAIGFMISYSGHQVINNLFKTPDSG